MTGRGRVLSLVLASLCAMPAAPLVARAQPETSEAAPPEAGEGNHADALANFREGKQLYGERRYLEAARAFGRSLAAAWSIEAAYNMALSYDRAEDLIAASAAYRLYLERAAGDDQHRATALERSEELRRRIGEVRLQIEGPGAPRQIKINGVEVAEDAFPWFTTPGPLDVEFIGERPGETKRVAAEVQPGGTVTIVFPGFPRVEEPPPKKDPVKPPSEPLPASQRRQKALRAGFWTSAALAAASGAAVAVFGGLSLYHQRRRNHLADLCPTPCSDPTIPDAEQRAAEVNGTRANVMIPFAAVLGVTAIALGVTILRERPRGPAVTRTRARWLGPAVELRF